MTTRTTQSELIAKGIGEIERMDWLKVSATFPTLKDWDESQDYPDWATQKIVDSVDPNRFEEEGITFGDLIAAFKAGFFGL